ncbi:Hpt domain-containing protein [bacterium]|nr:Hpt domain-containing protein [bacterium]
MSLDPEFFKELLSMFKLECEEHIQTMRDGIAKLAQIEPSDEQVEISETVHRSAHSLKGAARTIGLADVEPICQSLETCFSVLKRQKMVMPEELLSMLQRAVEGLNDLLGTLDESGKVTGNKTELTMLIDDINGKVVTLAR